jgi:diaminopimelate decarboxylase
VVADALWFLSRVHTLKKIGKKNILISYSGRHLLTPTNKSLLFPIELYITEDSNLNIIDDDLYVVGYTCIESDILGKVEVRFKSNSSDFIAISNVGSYSIVMGSDFILPQPAIYNFSNIGLSIVRHRKTIETIMSEFIY